MAEVNAWAVVFGGAITLVGSFGGAWWSNRVQQTTKAEQLAKAFKGELTAILHIVTVRDYAGGMRAWAAKCIEDNQIYGYVVHVREEYRAIYKGNASNLGLLKGSLPADIAIVYTQVAAVLEEFATQREYSDQGKLNYLTPTPHAAHARLTRAAEMVDDTTRRASELIEEIGREYP